MCGGLRWESGEESTATAEGSVEGEWPSEQMGHLGLGMGLGCRPLAGLCRADAIFAGRVVLARVPRERTKHGLVHRAGPAWAHIIPGPTVLGRGQKCELRARASCHGLHAHIYTLLPVEVLHVEV